MCKVPQVSVSGYHHWLRHPASRRGQKEQELVEQLRQAHAQSKRRYGFPRPGRKSERY
ncbi:hypothetical protein [Pontibacter saemangeumensis]|uniref:hypothetical protein n=1 Tax=Pontibacter saemangeumensis TaxID=1084525 RepID=UPI0031EA52B2